MHDTLLMVCREAVGSGNAKDAITLSGALGHARNETNMNLHELWKKGLIKRRLIKGYQDSIGRKRETLGYYIERRDIDRAIAKHLERPGKPRAPRPPSAEALMQAWPGQIGMVG